MTLGCGDGTDGAALDLLAGPRPLPTGGDTFLITEADAEGVAAHRAERHRHFVERQGLFADHDLDHADHDPDTIVLVARDVTRPRHPVVGGVRLHPVGPTADGHWLGSRLITAPDAPSGVGSALVRAACSRAGAEGALRFDAVVQAAAEPFFARLGWRRVAITELGGLPHVRMHWPTGRLALAADHKAGIGRLLAPHLPADRWRGDDGAPVPGSDVVAVADSILPAMVERDPWWAGWCSVLVNVNDLTAMGATPVGLLDHLAAPTESLAARVLAGMGAAADAWAVPLLGGHTQLGVHASLAVTMLGRTERPVPGGGARPGHRLSVVADLAGDWRPGYRGRQWDSTSSRDPHQLRTLQRLVPGLPATAAKDVSMAGLVGTVAMLAEASGVGAELELAAIPRPEGVLLADWLTCFPGYALVVAHDGPLTVPASLLSGLDHQVVVAEVGRCRTGGGVTVRWPDGHTEPAVGPVVTGLGPAQDATSTDTDVGTVPGPADTDTGSGDRG